jgi:hypothetical protein
LVFLRQLLVLILGRQGGGLAGARLGALFSPSFIGGEETIVRITTRSNNAAAHIAGHTTTQHGRRGHVTKRVVSTLNYSP